MYLDYISTKRCRIKCCIFGTHPTFCLKKRIETYADLSIFINLQVSTCRKKIHHKSFALRNALGFHFVWDLPSFSMNITGPLGPCPSKPFSNPFLAVLSCKLKHSITLANVAIRIHNIKGGLFSVGYILDYIVFVYC